MKKTFFSILFACAIFSLAYGQDSLKVTQGHFTTELNINPFKGELSLNNTLNQIKVRYFVANNLALRVGVNFNSKKNTIDNSSVYGTNPFTLKENKKTSTIGLNLGIENHFKGTKKLSPYVGAELVLASKSSSQTTTSGNNETKIDGAWETTTYTPNGYLTTYEERAYFQYGLNLLGGFDFYFAKHFYFGYEIAFALLQTNYKNIDITTKPTNGNQNTTDSTEKNFSVGPSLINGIRLGFAF